jgi:hypothetical protein
MVDDGRYGSGHSGYVSGLADVVSHSDAGAFDLLQHAMLTASLGPAQNHHRNVRVGEHQLESFHVEVIDHVRAQFGGTRWRRTDARECTVLWSLSNPLDTISARIGMPKV